MKKKKMNLEEIKVKSFVTKPNPEIKGGYPLVLTIPFIGCYTVIFTCDLGCQTQQPEDSVCICVA
ncbi:pinensin family lanthipeptide [Roseivirga sp. BDSF3-8]|uniref:pinensin family lanthipeptide n=1 Tax=Roseivirga sp. BDSF3-8 TaxID=3241598 RepID=UPI0035324B6B